MRRKLGALELTRNNDRNDRRAVLISGIVLDYQHGLDSDLL